ncbi:hypothetical protein N566_20805 [Streptomycetaceae bacterium MP113-05]|nr:hypothetical protein N566_20805 [Streptomycetaceae bacterium MP113-05]
MHASRSLRRRSAVAGTVCLLLAGAVACGPAEAAGPPAERVRTALDRTTAQESATVVADLDAPVGEVRALLSELGRDAGREQARRLAATEVAMALEADRPLNELETYGPGTRLVVGLCLGDRDVVSYKSVDGRVYLRLLPKELLDHGALTPAQHDRVEEIVGLADELPGSLEATRRLLTGGWVSLKPEAFQDYGWALEELTGRTVHREQSRGAAGLLDGEELRTALTGLENLLGRHTAYRVVGEDDGVERLRAELPARRTAKVLAPLLQPLGTGFDPAEVAEGRVPATVIIRRGSLAEARLDLGSLIGDGSVRVPLRLRFSPGDIYSPKAPRNAVELEPQDLLAAALFGARRS